jgi:uncharacterized membrane protein YeaQ/YmgE (transglycosylase-associated protein family)
MPRLPSPSAGIILSQRHKGGDVTLIDFILLLVVAGICGALGQAITGFTRGGCFAAIAIGFIGALIGMWLARVLGLPELFVVNVGGATFPIVWSILGSALFVAVISALTRRR